MNKRKEQLLFLVVLFFCFNLSAQIPFLKHRDVIELNNWSFFKGINNYAKNSQLIDASWKTVTVPHTYSLDAINTIGYYKGEAWYSTKVVLPETMNEKRIFIRFEGVGQEATIYLNGKKIGKHVGGYSAFCFEITDAIMFNKENILTVNVTNEPSFKRIPVNDKLFNHYGGIYRPVKIFATSKATISPTYFASSGVFVETIKVADNKAQLEVRTHVSNQSKEKNVLLNYEIRDEKNNLVKAVNKALNLVGNDSIVKEVITINNPILWNGRQQPHQYTLNLKVKNGMAVDEVHQKFGIKTFSVDANNGFFLNGKPYKMNGVCKHEEWQRTGPAVTEDMLVKDMVLIEEIGAKSVRLSHYQHSDKTYEIADEKGLLVWAEIPFVHDWSGREGGNAKQQLKELILQNYNHPSIIVWGLWNEVRAWNGPKTPSVVLTKELNSLAHKLDKTRLTISASDRGMVSEMGGLSDLQSWNKYYGWYSSSTNDLKVWLDTSHKDYADVKIGISEYGAGGNIQHQDASLYDGPKGHYFPEMKQAKYHEESWRILKDRPFVWSSFVWNMFDFSVASWNRGSVKNLNHKGLITFDRKVKKDAFYFYKANWSDAPVLYIAERRFKNRTSVETSIKVYTNLKEVTLYVNGKKFSKQKLTSDINVVTFKEVHLQEGDNTIKVMSKGHSCKHEDSVTWTFKKPSIALNVD